MEHGRGGLQLLHLFLLQALLTFSPSALFVDRGNNVQLYRDSKQTKDAHLLLIRSVANARVNQNLRDRDVGRNIPSFWNISVLCSVHALHLCVFF